MPSHEPLNRPGRMELFTSAITVTVIADDVTPNSVPFSGTLQFAAALTVVVVTPPSPPPTPPPVPCFELPPPHAATTMTSAAATTHERRRTLSPSSRFAGR